MAYEVKLRELGYTIEPIELNAGKLMHAVRTGNLVYTSGQVSRWGDREIKGKVGRDLTLEQGYESARLTGLSILASLKQSLGDLDRVTEWIRAVGYVHCAPDFGQNAAVVNGFSDLIVELWGDAGRHARSAPGQGPSPLNVPIIVDAIAAVSD